MDDLPGTGLAALDALKRAQAAAWTAKAERLRFEAELLDRAVAELMGEPVDAGVVEEEPDGEGSRLRPLHEEGGGLAAVVAWKGPGSDPAEPLMLEPLTPEEHSWLSRFHDRFLDSPLFVRAVNDVAALDPPPPLGDGGTATAQMVVNRLRELEAEEQARSNDAIQSEHDLAAIREKADG